MKWFYAEGITQSDSEWHGLPVTVKSRQAWNKTANLRNAASNHLTHQRDFTGKFFSDCDSLHGNCVFLWFPFTNTGGNTKNICSRTQHAVSWVDVVRHLTFLLMNTPARSWLFSASFRRYIELLRNLCIRTANLTHFQASNVHKLITSWSFRSSVSRCPTKNHMYLFLQKVKTRRSASLPVNAVLFNFTELPEELSDVKS